MMLPSPCTDENETLRMSLRAQQRSAGQPTIDSVLLGSERLVDAPFREQAAMLS